MEFSVGDRIGKFRVVREIGHGGMGCVYEVVAAAKQIKSRLDRVVGAILDRF